MVPDSDSRPENAGSPDEGGASLNQRRGRRSGRGRRERGRRPAPGDAETTPKPENAPDAGPREEIESRESGALAPQNEFPEDSDMVAHNPSKAKIPDSNPDDPSSKPPDSPFDDLDATDKAAQGGYSDDEEPPPEQDELPPAAEKDYFERDKPEPPPRPARREPQGRSARPAPQRQPPRPPPPPRPRYEDFRPATPQSVQEAIDDVNRVVDNLKSALDDMEELLETLELAERQKDADEREIDSLRRALRQVQRPRDGGGHRH